MAVLDSAQVCQHNLYIFFLILTYIIAVAVYRGLKIYILPKWFFYISQMGRKAIIFQVPQHEVLRDFY